MTAQQVIQSIRNVPDFPLPGIQFKDITTALAKPECLKWMRDEMANRYKNLGITQVVGIESRGFILAPALAIELNAGFVPIRKQNKLPAETISVTYKKEYGDDTIQIHKDALSENDIVLIHDDILATGGSMKAAIELVRKLHVKKVYVSCIIELDGLNGRELLKGESDGLDCLLSIEVDE
ncbi:MAG: adenine phosphoribosyltransferase [Paludibacteraceae bacterium]|nr:adenine phosphoribosyltransferase [Paludibacteraceae bacterium]